MMNKRRVFSTLLALIILLASSPTYAKSDYEAQTAPSSFVTTSGTKFKLNGEDFYFAGTNNYYFHYKSHKMVDDVFTGMNSMGLKVIRIWGFFDGQAQDNTVIQPSPGTYDESGLLKLDYAIAKAGELGIKLVLPLVNNWDDFGGMNQYVQWFNANSHDQFYTNASIKQAYKNYVSHILNRVNTITGVAYKNDPTIMTWELANEPRSQSDTTGNTLVNWASEMSTYIKSIDSQHLVAVGDEGFFNRSGATDWFYNGGEGVDWDRLIALPNIDYGTYHLYPDHWNKTPEWGTQWIIDHIEKGNAIGKPVVLEEFGYRNQATRDQVYQTWLSTIEQYNGAGSQFWILTGIQDDNSLYPDYDGFRVIYPSSTATVIQNHAFNMNSKSGTTQPTAPLAPTGIQAKAGNGSATISWYASPGATNYTVKRSNNASGPYTTVASNLTTTSYIDNGLTNGSTYYYRVNAANSIGASADSASVSVIPKEITVGNLSIQYKAAETGVNNNQIRPHFKIVNQGTDAIPYENLTLRYWYTAESNQAQFFDCDYAQLGCTKLTGTIHNMTQPLTGADHYLEISFASSAGTLAVGGNSGEIMARLHQGDWSNYNQANDYSFLSSAASFTEHNHITLYYNGVLIWGIEP